MNKYMPDAWSNCCKGKVIERVKGESYDYAKCAKCGKELMRYSKRA